MKLFVTLIAFVTTVGVTPTAMAAGPSNDLWAGALVVPLKNSEAKSVGEAKLLQTPHGVLIRLDLTNLAPGVHAFHIHEAGTCDPPAFTSAGGHFNPAGKKHGILVEDGKHGGDLPNIHVPASGALTIEILAAQVSLNEGNNRLLDDNGAALVIHSGADDYRTDPAGAAGERIACGVIANPTTK
ncbi:MAG: superoxide dismutase family protein [Candidatus Binatia bacterium]